MKIYNALERHSRKDLADSHLYFHYHKSRLSSSFIFRDFSVFSEKIYSGFGDFLDTGKVP